MMTIDQIRAELKDRNLQAVARGSGVHPATLYRLMQDGAQPLHVTVAALSCYLTAVRRGARSAEEKPCN